MDCQIYDRLYDESISWLYSQLPMFSRIGGAAYKPGLDNTLKLDRLYNSPHKNFKSIHIAGTNGKGSTSHMLSAILQSEGYKTGLYTSPHLTDFRERIRINGNMIPKKDVIDFVKDWKHHAESFQSTDDPLKPSFFELTMMMAFDWFAREMVDFAVIEVGMGGRLDSTNVITPILSVITNISFDHTQFLGHTLEEIAGEKAGIIKSGIPVVIGEAEGAVKDVFYQKSLQEKASIQFASGDGQIDSMNMISNGWKCILKNGKSFSVPLGGEYQKKNIQTVVCAVNCLRNENVKISDNSLFSGLENVNSLTGFRGRWQIFSTNPLVICDTGHNVAGLSESMKSLHERYPGKRIKFIIGFVNDKDVSHIVRLFPTEGTYYFTQASVPRAMPVQEVAAHFSANGVTGQSFKNVKQAYEAALSDADSDTVIYIGGSTFIVADFLQEFEGLGN